MRGKAFLWGGVPGASDKWVPTDCTVTVQEVLPTLKTCQNRNSRKIRNPYSFLKFCS